jgi:bisphosphoglycerate-dependent phosphoglycerate mutase
MFSTKPFVSTEKAILPKGDVNRRPGQKLMVLSYAGFEGARVGAAKGTIKVSGVFDDSDEGLAAASKFAELIRNENINFDVFIVEMNEWITLPVSTDIRNVIQHNYDDPRLQKMMQGHMDAIRKGKEEIDHRYEVAKKQGEDKCRKMYPTYEPKPKPSVLSEYEEAKFEQSPESYEAPKYSQADVNDTMVKFFKENNGSKIDGIEMAGKFAKYFAQTQHDKEEEEKKTQTEMAAAQQKSATDAEEPVAPQAAAAK